MSKTILQMPPTCFSRKIPYLTRRAAMADIRRNNYGGRPLEPYKCPRCPSWHLASVKGKHQAKEQWLG